MRTFYREPQAQQTAVPQPADKIRGCVMCAGIYPVPGKSTH